MNSSQSPGMRTHNISDHMPDRESLVQLTKFVFDRGQRPLIRGWFHLVAAFLSIISGSVLSTYAWMTLPWVQAVGVTVYALGFFSLYSVSAAYHRGQWRHRHTVEWWRRADHATIAVFIASTYTPLCLIALPGGKSTLMLTIAWTGALVGVVLSLVWINHPRWLAVIVYMVIGWLIVPLIPELWNNAGPTIVWLLFAGGIVYTVGAMAYAFKWPGREARLYGYHEHFHTATIVAGIIHLIAVWMVVVND